MRLTVLSYNILDGGRGRERELGEILAAQNADVILLQEVMEGRFAATLAEQLHLHVYVAASNSARHVALLTKLQINHAASFHPRILRHGMLEASVEYAPGKCLVLFGVHLSAPAYTLPIELYRLRELRVIFERIRQQGDGQMILAGDFNSIAPGDAVDFSGVPWSVRAMVLVQGGLIARQVIGKVRAEHWIDSFRALHPSENGFTLPSSAPHVRLDYIFVNEALRESLRGAEVVTTLSLARTASDHLPAKLELEM